MSDSVRPHRRQPTRLPHPWDSPGKNTGVGCHFLLQCMKVKSESEVAQSSPTLCDSLQPTRLLRPWDFLGKSTGVGCHCLLRTLHREAKNAKTADRLLDYTLATDKIEFDLNMGCRDVQVEKPWLDLKLICTPCSCCCNGYFKNGDTLTLYYSDINLCSF